MSRPNVLVKLSGDLIGLNKDMIEWLRVITIKSYVVIVVGGGKQINEAFKKRKWKMKEHGPLGREHENFEQRQVARDVLENNQVALQDRLTGLDINLTVEIPVIQVGSVLCHVNGDQYVLSAYNGFDKIYVVTTPGDRAGIKLIQFKKYPKIKVMSF